MVVPVGAEKELKRGTHCLASFNSTSQSANLILLNTTAAVHCLADINGGSFLMLFYSPTFPTPLQNPNLQALLHPASIISPDPESHFSLLQFAPNPRLQKPSPAPLSPTLISHPSIS
ncbi:hypothetical protein DM860_012055 [Cuscuta australis]|uniref:Uncharacterized protein n=1 Tax=Cuscuta australis TaxID=267555 RepID=A0A328D8T2_9ASTE|nr:hypothetical protein DM860_012055 [Cuscuta australis]